MSSTRLWSALEQALAGLATAREVIRTGEFDLVAVREALAQTVQVAALVAVVTGSLTDTAESVIAAHPVADDRAGDHYPGDTVRDVVDDLRMVTGNFNSGARLAASAVADLDHLHTPTAHIQSPSVPAPSPVIDVQQRHNGLPRGITHPGGSRR